MMMRALFILMQKVFLPLMRDDEDLVVSIRYMMIYMQGGGASASEQGRAPPGCRR